MPQLCANLGGHVDAVTGVVQASLGVRVGHLKKVLHHLDVGLKATRAHDHAVHGANAIGLPAILHLDAMDDLGGRILDEMLCGRLVPDIDVVQVVHQILEEVVECAVPARAVQAAVVHEIPAHEVLELAH